jgi:hypothetical protein
MTTNLNVLASSIAEEVASGDVLTCAQVARRGPSTRLGKPLHSATVLRWMLKGARLQSGGRVRLEAVRLGGRWVTSAAALERFIEAQTPSLEQGEKNITPRSAGQRRRAAERAAKKLEMRGI